jgi:UDP:flavonoid glycosyltransferase YjiC (YdhE family)
LIRTARRTSPQLSEKVERVSRILLAWEMGSNLGHLSRLLPLGRRLKARGHSVLAVVRDLSLAARILGPADIPFVQAPQMSVALKLSAQPASYADLLRHTGWADATQLWGMVQAWMNVLRLFPADIAVMDHSPTALLAARCTNTPCALIGTGFELPPLRQTLPTFPGFPGATTENASRAEAEVLKNANLVLTAARAPRLQALSDLFRVERRWLTTFAELDHYGPRATEQYVGPIGEFEKGERLEWPNGGSHRVFAYLRADTPHLSAVLRSLGACDAAVLCYGPGIPFHETAALTSPRFIVASRPVELQPLLQDASLCVSYSPAGTVASTLLRGVPQLLAPAHVEAQLTARRVECLGAGLTLYGKPSELRVADMLQKLLSFSHFKTKASAFAAQYRGFDSGYAADNIVDKIESIASRRPSAHHVPPRLHM